MFTLNAVERAALISAVCAVFMKADGVGTILTSNTNDPCIGVGVVVVVVGIGGAVGIAGRVGIAGFAVDAVGGDGERVVTPVGLWVDPTVEVVVSVSVSVSVLVLTYPALP